jgi:hypothetical protein
MNGNKMWTTTTIAKAGKTYQHVIATKEVNFKLLVDMCNPSSNQLVVSKVCYLLVLDVKKLLCVAKCLKSTNIWKPFIFEMWCGNKLVSPSTNSIQFLKLCFSWFYIGIWSSINYMTWPHSYGWFFVKR